MEGSQQHASVALKTTQFPMLPTGGGAPPPPPPGPTPGAGAIAGLQTVVREQAESLQSTKPLQLSSRPLLQISGSFAREALSKGVAVKSTLCCRLGSVGVSATAMLRRVSSQLNVSNGGVV